MKVSKSKKRIESKSNKDQQQYKKLLGAVSSRAAIRKRMVV